MIQRLIQENEILEEEKKMIEQKLRNRNTQNNSHANKVIIQDRNNQKPNNISPLKNCLN